MLGRRAFRHLHPRWSHRLMCSGPSDQAKLLIRTETTPNPDSLKFLVNRTVLGADFETGIDFTPTSEIIAESPLVKQLFGVDGTKRVFLGPDFVSVTKDPDQSWKALKPVLFEQLLDFFGSEGPVLVDEQKLLQLVVESTEDDDEIIQLIKELIHEKIRPAVQGDGGDIKFMEFDEEAGTLYVQLSGSCAGCPSAEVTLKDGVENMMQHYVPEVEQVVAVSTESLACRLSVCLPT